MSSSPRRRGRLAWPNRLNPTSVSVPKQALEPRRRPSGVARLFSPPAERQRHVRPSDQRASCLLKGSVVIADRLRVGLFSTVNCFGWGLLNVRAADAIDVGANGGTTELF